MAEGRDILADPNKPVSSAEDLRKQQAIPTDDSSSGVTWGDYGRTLKANTEELGSALGGGLRYITEPAEGDTNVPNAIGKYLQDYLGLSAEETRKGLTPEGRKRLEASVTSSDFWSHPISSSMLKATGMAPVFAAALIPGGIFADATAASVAAAGTFGAISAAQSADEFYKRVEKADDTELRQSEFYDELRKSGMGEASAKQRLVEKMRGNEPLINGIIGAATGLFGPAATATRAMRGGVGALGAEGRGVFGRMGVGAAGGGVGGGLQGAVSNIGMQQAEQSQGLRDRFDTDALVNAVLEPTLLQGGLGSVLGGVAGGKSKEKLTGGKEKPIPVPQQEGNQAPGTGPVPKAGFSADTQPPPPKEPDVGEKGKNADGNAGITTSKAEGATKQNYGKSAADKAAPEEPKKQPKKAAEAIAVSKRNEQAGVVPADHAEALKGEAKAHAPAPEQVAAQAAEAVQQARSEAAAARVAQPHEVAPTLEQGADQVTPQVTPQQNEGLVQPPAEAQPSASPAAPQPRQASWIGAHEQQLKKDHGFGISDLLNDPEVASALKNPKINREGDVPYVAGASESDSTVTHVDRHVPASVTLDGVTFDPARFVNVHEQIEKAAIRRLLATGMDEKKAYELAHEKYATPAERHAIELAGINWDKYQRLWKDWGRKTENEPNPHPPADLYREPYREEGGNAPKVLEALGEGKGEVEGAVPKTARVLEAKGTEQAKLRQQVNSRGFVEGEEKTVDARLKADAAKEAGVKTGKHYTTTEKAVETGRRTAADKVFNDHAPAENEQPYATYERAQAALKAAKDAKIKIPEELINTTPALTFLNEARFLVRFGGKDRTPGELLSAVVNFRDREHLLRTGKLDEVLSTRRSEGDLAKRVSQGDVEEKASGHGGVSQEDKLARSPEEILSEKQETTQRYGSEKEAYAAGKERKMPPKPKEILEAEAKREAKLEKVETLAERGATEGERTAAAAAVERVKAKSEEPTYTTPKAAREAVAVSKRNSMKGFRPPQEKLGEKLAALGTKKGTKLLSEEELRAPEDRSTTPKGWLRAETSTREAVKINSLPGNALGKVKGDYGDVPSIRTTKLSNLYDHLLRVGAKRDAEFMKFIDQRVRQMAGETPVHIVSNDSMMALIPDQIAQHGRVPPGYYDSSKHYIVLHEDLFKSKHSAAKVLVHEGLHAFTYHEISSNPKFERVLGMLMDTALRDPKHLELRTGKRWYGLTNVDEFVAELYSNPQFQQFLARIEIDPKMRKLIGEVFGPLDPRVKTVWQAFVDVLRKALGLGESQYTLLEAGLDVGRHLESARLTEVEKLHGAQLDYSSNYKPAKNPIRTKLFAAPEDEHKIAPSAAKRIEHSLMDHVGETVARAMQHTEMQEQHGKPWLLGVRTGSQLGQVSDNYFSSNDRGLNPVRRIFDTRERMRNYAQKVRDESEPFLGGMVELSRKYAGDVFDRFSNFVIDETMANVHASVPLEHKLNKHLQYKETEHLNQVWSRARHAELSHVYDGLPGDLKALHKEMLDYYSSKQATMAVDTIKNRILKALGHEDDALARRIYTENTTDADLKTLGDGNADSGKALLDTIQKAGSLAQLEGAYHPLMRRGDFVMRAHYDAEVPKNATKVKDLDNTYDFKDRKEAEGFVRQQAGRPGFESVWVDKNTGNTRFPDDTKVTPQDVDAEQRFRVKLNNRHVEFFETEKEARAAAAELEKEIGPNAVKGVVARQYEPRGRDADIQVGQMNSLLHSLQQRSGWEKLSSLERKTIADSLNELAVRSMGSTRIQSRRLPRRGVAGPSRDIVRNTYDYTLSMSEHLAKLKHAPELEAAIKEMGRQADNDYPSKDTSVARSTLRNETLKRLDQPLFDEANGWHAWTKRLMTMSFLDKLAGPSQNIINALQYAMVAAPTIASRHGWGRTFSMSRQVYNDIGGLSIVKQGFKDTYKKIRGGETGNIIDDIVKQATKTDDERAAFKYFIETSAVDPSSGIDISQLMPARSGVGGKVDIGLGYLEGISRQMPKAVEAMNRAVTGLVSYRLERERGASHDRAMLYAKDMIDNTQFIYSPTNRPPVFNHPLARLSLQFKQYAQGMYSHIGTQIGRAVEGRSPQERAEAIKTLAGIAATHVAFAGLLGLPTEPIKYLLIPLAGLGLPVPSWGDVEDRGRRIADGLFGKAGGEAVMAGLPRLLGIDLSGRVGLSSMTSFSEPRQSTDSEVKKWLFDNVAGAPASLVGDWFKGGNALLAGNFEKAAELMVPFKMIADGMRAYRQSTEGKKSAAGRETMSPYTPYEAGVRAMGFTPSREAETGAQSAAFYKQKNQIKEDRQKLIGGWVNAKPGDKGQALKDVQAYNKGKAEQDQIKMKDLDAAKNRREQEGRSGAVVSGIKTTKQDKHLLDNSPYNVHDVEGGTPQHGVMDWLFGGGEEKQAPAVRGGAPPAPTRKPDTRFPDLRDTSMSLAYDRTYGDPVASYTRPGGAKVNKIDIRDVPGFYEDTDTKSSRVVLSETDAANAERVHRDWIASERSPVSKLGFSVSRTVTSPPIRGLSISYGRDATLRGFYNPKGDALWADENSQSTVMHESLHRGIGMLRREGKLPKNVTHGNEEFVVRALMRRHLGGIESTPENLARGADRITDAQLDELETAAGDYLAKKRPMGPR